MKHLSYVKSQVKYATATIVTEYLKRCIAVLESELEGKKKIITQANDNVIGLLESIGYDKPQAGVLAILFANESVKARILAIGIDKTRVYRILSGFENDDIVAKTNTNIVEFFILDKDNPFGSVINSKIKEAEKLMSVSKEITKLIK